MTRVLQARNSAWTTGLFVVKVLAALGCLSVASAAWHPENEHMVHRQTSHRPLSHRRASAIDTDLPDGWETLTDPITHGEYYYNAVSRVGTWNMPLPNLVSSLPDCKAEMMSTSYTHCASKTDSRALTYFYTKPCKAGQPLPPAVASLPCNITCSPGQYLPLGTPECAQCEPGTYAVGGGTMVMNWEKMPEGLTTKCDFQLEADKDEHCSGWVLNGTNIFSGDMRGRRLVDSTLRYEVELVRAGTVTFEYKVDAERRWDGLYFTIDGQEAMEMTSYKFQYTKVSLALPAGFHTLEWVYHKDVAYEMGQDRAWIRSIQVLGTKDNTESCSKCPIGHFSESGSSECTKCPVNTFGATSGNALCQPCNPAGTKDGNFKFALPGAKACKKAPLCKEGDILTSYSECTNMKRTSSEAYNQPQICHGGVTPKPDKKVDCAFCEPGMFRKSKNCEWCPVGSYNPTATHKGDKVCKSCPTGSIAKKVKWYDNAFAQRDFQKYQEEGRMATGCANGYCAQGGFRALGDRMDSGVGNGQVADIWLSLTMHLETWGEISFNFSMHSSNMESRLEFYLDEERMWEVESMQEMNPNDAPLSFSSEVPPGSHLATWVLHKEREYSWMEDGEPEQEDEDVATIDSILVEGVEVGGAVDCIQCPAGYVSAAKSSMCSACPPGQFSVSPGKETCVPCPAGTYASEWGSSKCHMCGHGTDSGPGQSNCDVSAKSCHYAVDDDTVFDLHALARVNKPMWGPVVDLNNSQSYYINMCSLDNSNGTCIGRDGQAVRAYACQQSDIQDDWFETSLAVSLGSVMAFYTLPGREREGLMVSFQEGTRCQNGDFRSMNITMLCDLDAGPGMPTLKPGQPVEVEKCQYELEWYSQSACPQCTIADMESIEGECTIVGTRTINMIWKEPRSCFGGLELPKVSHQKCVLVAMDKTKVALIAAVSALTFILLISSLVCMYVRNRKIYREYSVLKEQNEADLELERYTLDDEDA